MHLIQKKLAGVGIPATIPLSLMPPSMRGNHPPPVAPLPVQESIQDLLWDDTPPPSAITSPPQTLQPQRTGPIQPQAQILQPQRTGPLSSQPTGVQQPVSTSSPPPQRFPPANQDTFSSSQCRFCFLYPIFIL
jgi:epidermal growth factor receptor substrate 15